MRLREVPSLERAIRIDGRENVHFIVFSTLDKSQDRAGFYASIIQYIPCDPEFYGRVWDAGLDSISGGLFNLPFRNLAVYWLGSRRFRRRDPVNYKEFKADFLGLATNMARPEYTGGHPKDVIFYFGK